MTYGYINPRQFLAGRQPAQELQEFFIEIPKAFYKLDYLSKKNIFSFFYLLKVSKTEIESNYF